jgi:hypothetical protein
MEGWTELDGPKEVPVEVAAIRKAVDYITQGSVVAGYR